MKPLVSVIIPTLNEEKYIKKTLLALKHQDYAGKFEIIVVDSHSKDKTVKIAEKFSDKVIQTDRRGVGRARNEGAKAATGKLLIFLDGDTIVLPNLLSEFVKSFEKKKVIAVTCPTFPIEASPKNILFYAVYNINIALTLKTKRPHIAGICVGYRGDAFFKLGGFDEHTHALEDFILSEKIPRLGTGTFNPHTAVFTSTRRLQRWGALKSVKNYFKFYIQYMLNGKRFGRSEYRPIR